MGRMDTNSDRIVVRNEHIDQFITMVRYAASDGDDVVMFAVENEDGVWCLIVSPVTSETTPILAN